ncbi:hypothetical protein P245_10810 [Comamonas thiooxydans]|uniref:Virion structural protein n=1 Tax=Comamonas thiooxydans TaxID=363952 RepID=A0A0E3BLM2_9BURK|nr:hypothetical protein [Comamonas thiooxydans]KGG93050.1 hypothetical protein P245_10810 [Comamonas thiooxydans]
MAYITGASADINTLLTAIKNFAVANGWTANVTDTFTMTFWSYGANGLVAHADTTSMVSSVGSSDAYRNQGETSLIANRVVLTKNGVSYQLFAVNKKLVKNGVSGTYACLEAWACDGFAAGTAANLQANNRKFVMIGPMATSLYAYHLFSNGDFIHLVIEETPGRFRHLSFGFINKYGAFAGGQYLTAGCPVEASTTTAYAFNTTNHMVPFGSNSQATSRAALASNGYAGSYVRADIDGWTVGWRLLSVGWYTTDQGDAYGCTSYANAANTRAGYNGGATQNSLNSLAHDLAYHCSPQSYNGLAPMLPCYVGVNRAPYVGTWTLLGEFPDVRFLNIANFNPGDELTLGTDVWKIFPLWNKAYTLGAEPISYDYGVAYRKVV